MSRALIDECKSLLIEQGINPASTIEFTINETIHTLSLQQIIETFMQASEEAQLVFITALKKAMESGNMGIQSFFEGMGKLLLMSQFSDKDITVI
ncbi:MAG: hypothetical protein U9Q62_10000 [Campylobacterota bacterium]|nr:hypothetical protein [Campylobacterota bacterium]